MGQGLVVKLKLVQELPYTCPTRLALSLPPCIAPTPATDPVLKLQQRPSPHLTHTQARRHAPEQSLLSLYRRLGRICNMKQQGLDHLCNNSGFSPPTCSDTHLYFHRRIARQLLPVSGQQKVTELLGSLNKVNQIAVFTLQNEPIQSQWGLSLLWMRLRPRSHRTRSTLQQA